MPDVPRSLRDHRGSSNRNSLGGEWHFTGLMDEVKIYNRALSDEEIKATFEAGGMGG